MQTRRDVLGAGGTAMLATLAGCRAIPFLGGDSRGNPAEWIPTALELGEEPTIAYWHPARLADVEAIDDYHLLPPTIDMNPVDVQNIATGSASFGNSYRQFRVWNGNFDGERARDGASIRYSEESNGEYGGFDRYTAKNGGSVFGWDGDVAIGAAPPLFEAIVDAIEDDGGRLVETNDEFELLAETVGTVDYLGCEFTDSPGPHSDIRGRAYEFGQDVSDVTLVGVYEDESVATDAAGTLQEVPEFPTLSDPTETVDGRVVTVTGTLDTGRVFEDDDE